MPENTSRLFSVRAPIRITKIIDVVPMVSISASLTDRQLSRRRRAEITKAPTAPMPAASVGVKTPK